MMARALIRRLVVPGLLLAGAVPVVAQNRGLRSQDAYQTVSVGNVAVSPPGDFVAYQMTTVDEAKNNRREAIWMQAMANGAPRGAPFRFTDPTQNSTAPGWSPDGSILHFTSRRGEEEGSIWFLRVRGPGGEAFRIEGVGASPIWSPDGSRIAFVMAPKAAGEAADRRARRVAPDAITKAPDPKRFDGNVVTQRRYKRDGTFEWLPHPDHNPRDQIFVVPPTGGEPVQITDLPYSASQVEWSPDGSYFVFVLNEQENNELNFDPASSIWRVDSRRRTPPHAHAARRADRAGRVAGR